MRQNDSSLSADLAQAAHEIPGRSRDYDPLLNMIGDAQIVMLGEATHGTQKFYRERANIIRRLITERGLFIGPNQSG